jgi:hypothetical protein
MNTKNDRRAAIVCSHVARDHAPILRAVRDEPEMDEDSGWQFLCDKNNENSDEAQVWLVCEVLEDHPSLSEIIESPPGTIATRLHESEPWQITTN